MPGSRSLTSQRDQETESSMSLGARARRATQSRPRAPPSSVRPPGLPYALVPFLHAYIVLSVTTYLDQHSFNQGTLILAFSFWLNNKLSVADLIIGNL